MTTLLFCVVVNDAFLFGKKAENVNETNVSDVQNLKPTEKHIFGKDGVIHEKVEEMKANYSTRPHLFGKNGTIHEKVEQFKTDLKTKPLVNSKVNAKVKILHSEVGFSGGIVIGGNKTGAHMSANAKILGQQANVHANILNGNEGKIKHAIHFGCPIGHGSNAVKNYLLSEKCILCYLIIDGSKYI